MQFGLSEEQRLLQSSLTRMLEERASLAIVREAITSNEVTTEGIQGGLLELGIPGLLVPHNHGGLGLGMLDAAITAEALGTYVAPAAFTAPFVMAPIAIHLGSSQAQADEWLPAIADGSMRCAVGVSEHAGARSRGVKCVNGKLYGEVMFVLDVQEATDYLIADGTGSLYRLPADAPGVTMTPLTTVDLTRANAAMTLEAAAAEILPRSNNAQVIRETIDAGRIALAADTLGAAQTMLGKSVAYALEREQFGRVIGSFQAVKHMCAEMAAALEPCRAMVWHAAHAYDEIPEEGPLLSCHVKAHLAEVGKMVAKTATEVHGGMGFTDLLGLHYWFKRIGVNRQTLGGPEVVREEAARLQGWVE